MKNFSIHEVAGCLLLVAICFSPADGSLVADVPTIFLAALTVAGMFACECLLPSRRRRPAPTVVDALWRN